MENIRLNLIVAYDLTYSNTQESDYVNISNTLLDMIDGVNFIGCTKKKKKHRFFSQKELFQKKPKNFYSVMVMRRNAMQFYIPLSRTGSITCCFWTMTNIR